MSIIQRQNQCFLINRENIMSKYMFLIIINIFMLIGYNVFSQNRINEICATHSSNTKGLSKMMRTNTSGGMFIPAQGTLRILVVFAKFNGDNTDDEIWGPNSLPIWGTDLVSTFIQPNYQAWSLSDYFHKMSVGKLNVIGDVYPNLVETDSTAQDYYNHQAKYGDVNKSILRKIDPFINYSKYDSFAINGAYNYSKQSDGYVDIVIIIYRSIDNSAHRNAICGGGWSGTAMLGFSDNVNTNDGVAIKSITNPISEGTLLGGITLMNFRGKSKKETVAFLAHELGHYLFGQGHPHSNHLTNTDAAYGLMGGIFSPTMNAVERERMGYITIKEFDADTIHLTDYLTTNTAYKITPQNNNPDSEYFVLENHLKFDTCYDAVGFIDYTGTSKGK